MTRRLPSHDLGPFAALLGAALLATACSSPPTGRTLEEGGDFEERLTASAAALGLDPEAGTLDVFLAFEASLLLEDFDVDADGRLHGDEVAALLEDLGNGLDPETFARFESSDDLHLRDLWSALRQLEHAATFEVDGDVATMQGTIDGSTPDRVAELIANHPRVRSIVMREVPGSVNDEANLAAARLVRAAGLSTHLLGDSVIASGGTDFFLAGARRTIEPGAQVGVHSWGGGDEVALDLPRDHDAHRLYLDYYEEMGIPTAFYWFTLQAAPASGIHWMRPEELEAYRFELLDEDP